MALSMSRLTREYVFWDIDTVNDLSSATAEVAFIDNPIDIPTGDDWKPAELENEMGVWRVKILVGPNHPLAVDLTPPGPGSVDYESWTRINDNPEQIVRRPGVVTIV